MKYKEHEYWKGYRCDEDGNVLGKRGSTLKPIRHHTGYSVMTVRGHGKQRQLRVHRFIWECFNGPITDKSMVINHIDGDKSNNSLRNLELVTSSANCVHAHLLGLSKGARGSDNPASKLSEGDATEVISMCLAGCSNRDIGLRFGIHPNYVSLIRHRRRWQWLWDRLHADEN